MSEQNKVTRSLPIPSNPQIVPFSKQDRMQQNDSSKEIQTYNENIPADLRRMMDLMTPRERLGLAKGERKKGEKKEPKIVEVEYMIGKLNGSPSTMKATAKTMMIKYRDPDTGEYRWFPKVSFDSVVSEWKQMLINDPYTFNIQLEGSAVFLFIWYEVKETRTLGQGITWKYGKVECHATREDAEKAAEYWQNKPIPCTVEFSKNLTKSIAYALVKRSTRG